MKPRQLATLLNISSATLRRWAGGDYGEFLSPRGQGINGAYRSFDEHDARILAWVGLMRAQNTSTDEIYVILKAAQKDNWRGLPPLPGGMADGEPIAVVPREAVEERVHALQERFELQLQAITKERDQLRQQLEAAHEDARIARQGTLTVQQETSGTIQTLQQRITELSAREAELRGKLGLYMIADRVVNPAVVVLLSLVLGIIITLLIIVLVHGRL